MWRCLNTSSHRSRDSLHVVCGLYFPDRMGIRSFTVLPNSETMPGDIFIVGSEVFRYWRIDVWNASMLISPSLPTLPKISRLKVLTPTSAQPLLCGNAIELRQWCAPHQLKNSLVMWDTNMVPHLMRAHERCYRWKRCVIGS